MFKKILFSLVFLLTVCSSAYANGDLLMCIGNNRAVSSDEVVFIDNTNQNVVPVIINDRTMVPVRFIGEVFNFNVNWDESTETISLIGAEKMISFALGSNEMTVESAGKVSEYVLDAPPTVINDRTFLPLRAIAEQAMGMEVYWDGKSIIVISKDKEITDDLINKSALITTKPKMELKDFPLIDGSTATNPFVIELAKTMLGVSENTARKVTLLNKTHQAIVNLINGDVDIVFVTHPSEDELAYAKKKGVDLEIVPFSKEGFVFLNHKDNIVDNLTLEQVREVYEGKITNWSEVGGKDSDIIPYQRLENSGSQTNMIEFMAGRTLMTPPKEQVIEEMGGLIEAVANYQNSEKSLGYSVFYYAKEMYSNPNIKLLKINEVMPTSDSIRSMEYPIVSNYYAVIRKSDDENSPGRKMLNWVLGKDGQALVDKCGLVSM